MNRPMLGLTVGAADAAARAGAFGVDFCDLHFWGKADRLPSALEQCDRLGLKYVLNYECFCGGPVSPVLRETLKPCVGGGRRVDPQ